MKKMYKVIIVMVTILFFIETIVIKVSRNTLEDIFLISIMNAAVGFFAGIGIYLLIIYPKSKDCISLIIASILMIITLKLFCIGIAVNQIPNYFLFISIILGLISLTIATFNLRKIRNNGQ